MHKDEFHPDHIVKCRTLLFMSAWMGEKQHEIRYNDRNYKLGQSVRLLDYSHSEDRLLGPCLDIIILSIRYAPKDEPDPLGLLPGFCVFDFMVLNRFDSKGNSLP